MFHKVLRVSLYRAAAAALVVMLTGCTGGGQPVPQSGAPRADVRAELDALPVPAGADAAAFAALKRTFADMLDDGLVADPSKQTSAGLGTEINDLTITNLGGGTIELSWTYRHRGDYDQNGEVNVSDISPIGVHFGKTNAGADWNMAQVADGDSNGQVLASDLTPIGQNFGSIVQGYVVESTATPGDAGSWAAQTTVTFSQSTIPAGQAFRQFTVQLAGQTATNSFRATPQTSSTGGGTNPATYDEVENNDTYTTPNILPAGSVTGFTGSLGSGSGYTGYDGDSDDLFSFTAASGDHLAIDVSFNGATGDIDLYLLNSSGGTLLSSLGEGTDTENIQANVTSGGTFLIALKAYSGYSDYTLDLTITGGGGFVEPPTETFVDYSQAGDTAARRWLLNCYRPLPAWQDGDRVFQNDTLRAWADEVLALTNQERANNGLPALIHDVHLELVAQAHSRDMALQQFFAHENPYGMRFDDRLLAVNRPAYSVGSSIAGENIYAGRAVPVEDCAAAAVDGWMNSPPHRENILNPNVTHLGVGVYYHTGDPSSYYVYFTQVFANWAVDPDAHDWLEPAEVPAP
ncbi:pre-peptidase C-terminal domain-containing protein [bacterium]|nr:pre-peptidase C-terminal domain-containing protein [bacterium]